MQQVAGFPLSEDATLPKLCISTCICISSLATPLLSISAATQGDELSGEACLMGGNVWGFCQEVRACLGDGGVAVVHGEVHLCQRQLSDIIVCCRKPHLVAKESESVYLCSVAVPDGQ